MSAPYVIKCDDCKRGIGVTNSLAESAQGGRCDACQPSTVKRPDLFGNVNDTYQTEAELNGWRVKQGSLL